MRNSLLWSSFAFALLACSHHSKPQVATAGPPVADTSPTTSKCGVMQTPGTNVVTADTNDGVAIVFTTTGDVSDLRTQVRQIADHHNEMIGGQPGQGPSAGGPSAGGPMTGSPSTGSPDTHSAGVGGDVHGNVGDHTATAGADVHGGVQNSDNTHGAGVGGDVHAGTKDKTATVGADVHAGVKDKTAKIGGDVHAGIKDKDKDQNKDQTNQNTGAGVGADVHGGVNGNTATAATDVRAGVNGHTATAGADVRAGVNGRSPTAGAASADAINSNNTATAGGMTGQGDLDMIPARARVEDIPGGERLVLVPQDPSQLPALREQARQQVSLLEKGECPRLMTEPQGMPTGDQPNRHPTGT